MEVPENYIHSTPFFYKALKQKKFYNVLFMLTCMSPKTKAKTKTKKEA